MDESIDSQWTTPELRDHRQSRFSHIKPILKNQFTNIEKVCNFFKINFVTNIEQIVVKLILEVH